MIHRWLTQYWNSLIQLKNQGRLPHALMLHGSEGIGKKGFALHFARSLLCASPNDDGVACGHCQSCKLVEADTHPDLSLIRPIPPDKSKSKKPVLNIRIEVIRDLCKKLSTTSRLGGYRVVIIEDADRMIVQAANALLKTLEEPGQDTLLLLVSSRPHKLPVTIRSRCQSIHFAVPDNQEALSWLESQGVQNPGRWLNYAHGAPLLAVRYAEEQHEERQLLAEALLASSNGKSSLSYAKKLAALPKEPVLAWLLDWVGDVVRLKHCKRSIQLTNEDFREKLLSRAESSDTRRVFAYYDQICHHIRQDRIALNEQLLWENLLISWENL
jgi:DNA polymerase-3 subunit delta'